MVQEGAPFLGPVTPATFDPWSRRNMLAAGADGIAPRTSGSVEAMEAAYESGLYFDGDVDIPLIDWRHYREEDLDMHNSHQSFASRQRMLDHDGDAANMVVWFTDGRPARLSDQTMEAFAVLDEWMANRRANPGATAAQTRPALAVDRCFTATGQEIARGDDVWDGILDDDAGRRLHEGLPDVHDVADPGRRHPCGAASTSARCSRSSRPWRPGCTAAGAPTRRRPHACRRSSPPASATTAGPTSDGRRPDAAYRSRRLNTMPARPSTSATHRAA